MAKRVHRFDYRTGKRFTDKQRAAYWKKKYFDCKHDLESLQGFKRR